MAQEILIVDDEADIRTAIAGVLHDEGYTTRDAAESEGALEALAVRRPSLVILDIWLNNSVLDGLQLLAEVKREHAAVPVVMISGHGNIETAVKAIKMGAYDFIEKPFKADRLLHIVERAIEAARLRRENEELRQRGRPETELIGESARVTQLRQAIGKVAPTNSRVLITGPAGVGKEVVARMIHSQSHRAQGPFLALNCATMHPDRLELELFGSEAGLEDAEAPRRVGTFERAHGGTLLLDEVADMPLETQGKIVRILQEQSFERLGGNRRVEVDVRVFASSNRDLLRLIGEGRFREDLYYRLNVVPLSVPALKERREDIAPLVAHFMGRAAELTGLSERPIGEDALAALRSHDWPGNVRQLRNVIDWILIMVPGGSEEPVRADMLPPDIKGNGPLPVAGAEGGMEVMSLPLREARGEFERHYLAAQVMRFGGNVSRTASFIGMERSALHRKLRALGITTGER
jgi:two-component system nitrogen regulation response regulator NtrX